ncbi:carboxypeptidase-like regulatory domain-containing protein [Winogradskyella sp. A3E31]|uniref:carboxypeptidase-like regulatory domain-containing protein n=1 Tax=Winogradskyella sp. A3E31 TaxID=3349637 RepID=UPI00398BB28E
MTKFILPVFLICFNSVIFSQNIKITGIVFNEQSKKPISDVLIIVDNEILTFTDLEGKYFLELPNQLEKEIIFSHISYQTKSYNLDDLIITTQIALFSKNNELDEVVISGKKRTKKEILKSAITNYKNQVRKEPYWSSVNLKQVTKLNDSLPSYIEVDGNLFSLGDDRNVWNLPILIPKQSRRTKENFLESSKNNTSLKVDNKPYINYGLEIFNSSFLLNYRFFEIGHPLSKNGNSLYKFTLGNTIELNNEECYIINYEAKKPNVKIKGRIFYSIRGQIIVTRDNLTLKKMTSLFRRSRSKDGGIDVILTIDYSQIEKLIYPKDILYKVMFFNFESKGVLHFNNIDITPRENYRNSISSNRFLFQYSQVYNNYSSSYWKNKPVMDDFIDTELKNLFKEKNLNDLFIIGNNQKIKVNTKDLNTELPEKAILTLMNSDMN